MFKFSHATHLFADGQLSHRSRKEKSKQIERLKQLAALHEFSKQNELKRQDIPAKKNQNSSVITAGALHMWLQSRFNESDAFVKHKIEQIFGSDGSVGSDWKIIDPPADGFCGLHAINIARQLLPNHLVSNIIDKCPNKNLIIDYIIEGITEYRRVLFKIYTDINNPTISSIIKKKLVSLLDSMGHELATTFDDSDRIFTINMYTDFENDNLTQKKRDEIRLLKNKGNVEVLFLQFLAYKFKHSFIFLFYERRQITGNRCTYGDIKYNDYTINIQANTIEKVADNTSILFNDGHYFLFYNEDKQKELSLIDALRNNNNGQTFWQTTNEQAVFWHTPAFITRLRTQFNDFMGHGKRITRQRQRQRQRQTLRRSKTLRRKQIKRQTLRYKK